MRHVGVPRGQALAVIQHHLIAVAVVPAADQHRTAVGGAVKAAPGTIVRADKTGIEIACGDGRTLRILELQPQNGKRMAVASYLAGHPVQVTV